MKSHAALGAQLVGTGDSPYLHMGAEIAMHHHERWDGSGYPGRLKGQLIPISARIMNICDQYDALRSERPHRKALSHEAAVEILTVGDGRTMPGHFDPDVLEAFKRSAERFREIFESIVDGSVGAAAGIEMFCSCASSKKDSWHSPRPFAIACADNMTLLPSVSPKIFRRA